MMLPLTAQKSSVEHVFSKKHKSRAIFRAISFLSLLAGYAICNSLNSSNGFLSSFAGGDVPNDSTGHTSRMLEDVDNAASSCDDLQKSPSPWWTALYIAGVLYLFLALAIVCDEFFVPALEEISSERRLNLSMDVAGATLMAAGGSAPELFTALFGTFQESAVGFGTIVGSAVFNVLFVIGMCSLLSREVLQLTWWPLFRDSTYYVIGLGTLAYFVGINSEGEIELWEAAVLFAMYIGYVILMMFNEKIQACFNRKKKADPEISIDGDEYVLHDGEQISKRSLEKQRSLPDFRWPGTFRAGVVKLMRKPKSWATTAGVGLVLKLKGNVDDAFRSCDKNRDGKVDLADFTSVVKDLNLSMDEDEVKEVFAQLDENGDGTVGEREFLKWYISSEKFVMSSVRKAFNAFDTNHSGTIDRNEIRALLMQLEPGATEKDVDEAMEALNEDGDTTEITYEEFSRSYMRSSFYEKQKVEADEDMQGIFASLRPPKEGGCLKWIEYIVLLPLIVTLAFTIPDVRRAGMGRWCYVAFILAIVWIGVYSYFMVDWAEIIGNTFGVPAIVMGLTFLAAGTSVPDLLSSVIVARRGEGDMAVSSSVGSNIFDILVGLPLPWLAYTAYPGKPDTVQIGSDGVGLSIVILVGMIILIIATIHLNRWRLTKTAGVMMFVFYILFLVQAIWQELPFDLC